MLQALLSYVTAKGRNNIGRDFWGNILRVLMEGTGKSQKEGQRKNSKMKAGQKGKVSGLRKLNSKSAH